MKFAISDLLRFNTTRRDTNHLLESESTTNSVSSSSSRQTLKKATSSATTARRLLFNRKDTLVACQRFIGRPMTREEAKKKLEGCKNFRDIVSSDGDTLENAIAFDYGSRLRSCMLQSKRNIYHHGNRAHY
jgi:hypothetical protein